MSIQSKEELEKWYALSDPWNYEAHPDDTTRKSILLAEIPNRLFRKVLDIGCGEGFLTQHLPGAEVVGVDISSTAISRANERKYGERFSFHQGSIFQLPDTFGGTEFDLILITGVLYPQYIGSSELLIYDIVDSLLAPNGILISVHITSWYQARFSYLLMKELFYSYRDHTHLLQAYTK